MPPPAHTPQAAPREPAPPPTLPQELLSLVASLTTRLTDLEQHQIPQLATCKGPSSLHEQLAAEVRQAMTAVRKDVEELKLQVDDLDKARDRRAGADHVVTIQLRVEAVTKQYRQAVIASKKLIDASGVLSARDELFSSAAKAGAPEGTQTTKSSSKVNGATKTEKTSGQGEDDALMSATSDVTEGLRRTLQLMQQEVDRSMMSNEMLVSQTKTMQMTSDQYSVLGTVLNTSKALITSLERADLLDRLILLAAMLLFGLVCAWIFKRRVLNKGLRVASALSQAVSRGQGQKVVAEVVHDVKHDLKQAVKSAPKGIRSDATQVAVVVTSVVASAVHAAKTAVASQREDWKRQVEDKFEKRVEEQEDDETILDKMVKRVPGAEDIVNDWFGSDDVNEDQSQSSQVEVEEPVAQEQETILNESQSGHVKEETVLDKIVKRVPGAEDALTDWFGVNEEEQEKASSVLPEVETPTSEAPEPEQYTDEDIGADHMPQIVAELYQNATSPSDPDDEVRQDPEAVQTIVSIAESGLELDDEPAETAPMLETSASVPVSTAQSSTTIEIHAQPTEVIGSEPEETLAQFDDGAAEAAVDLESTETVPSEYPLPPSSTASEPASTTHVTPEPTAAPAGTVAEEATVEETDLETAESASPPEEPTAERLASPTEAVESGDEDEMTLAASPTSEPSQPPLPTATSLGEAEDSQVDNGAIAWTIQSDDHEAAAPELLPDVSIDNSAETEDADEEALPAPAEPAASPTAEPVEPIPVATPTPTTTHEELEHADFTQAEEALEEDAIEPVVTFFDDSTPTYATRDAEEDVVFTPKPLRPATPDLEDRQAIIDENRIDLELNEDVLPDGEVEEQSAAIVREEEVEQAIHEPDQVVDEAVPESETVASPPLEETRSAAAELDDEAVDEPTESQLKPAAADLDDSDELDESGPVVASEPANDDVEIPHYEQHEYIEPPDEPEPFTLESVEDLGAEYDDDVLAEIASTVDQEQEAEEEFADEASRDGLEDANGVPTVTVVETATETKTVEVPVATASLTPNDVDGPVVDDATDTQPPLSQPTDIEPLESEPFEGVNDPAGVTMPAFGEETEQDEEDEVVETSYEPVEIPQEELEYAEFPAVQDRDEEEMVDTETVADEVPSTAATARVGVVEDLEKSATSASEKDEYEGEDVEQAQAVVDEFESDKGQPSEDLADRIRDEL
ncbi:hypothetical protein ACM66B_004544 [Microbotryomycetes sp. NB124-2]